MLAPRLVNSVQMHALVRRVLLKVECGDLDRLLFISGQANQIVDEGVGDTELHGHFNRPMLALWPLCL